MIESATFAREDMEGTGKLKPNSTKEPLCEDLSDLSGEREEKIQLFKMRTNLAYLRSKRKTSLCRRIVSDWANTRR